MAGNSYHDRLQEDAPYLTSNGKLSERAVDKIILQLNRVYPQIIYNKDAEKFRNPKTPLRKRLSDLLTYLQNKGDLACQEFYRALRNNAESVYATLPSRNNLSNPSSPVEIIRSQEKIILNDRDLMWTHALPYGTVERPRNVTGRCSGASVNGPCSSWLALVWRQVWRS
uniref:Caspase recruitment domain-containing protein 19 n=1 Tax=Leptobrachium leishanense TaxID=445787 RepID=A0A8C5R209_9ANUR